MDTRGQRLLRASVGVSLVALVVALVGLLVDDTTITGAAAWQKPTKFAVSVTLYVATLGWLLTLVRGHRRLVGAVAGLTAAALVGELGLIDLQVLRGTSSHFNTDTAFDAGVFQAMGVLVAGVLLALAVTAVLLLRQRGLPRVLATGIRAGLLVTLLGMAEAGLMLVNGATHPGSGHTVGGRDGGPGLPFTGWSTDHGDLRVAHFVGLHALQLLPLLGLALHRWARLPDAEAVRGLRVAGAAYAGLVVLLTWQAQTGRPLLHPSAAMLAAAGVLVAVAAAAVLGVTRAGAGAAPAVLLAGAG